MMLAVCTRIDYIPGKNPDHLDYVLQLVPDNGTDTIYVHQEPRILAQCLHPGKPVNSDW